jgi:hypothetical protein
MPCLDSIFILLFLGVDNAALWFNKVRIPRQNLLNAHSNMVFI